MPTACCYFESPVDETLTGDIPVALQNASVLQTTKAVNSPKLIIKEVLVAIMLEFLYKRDFEADYLLEVGRLETAFAQWFT